MPRAAPARGRAGADGRSPWRRKTCSRASARWPRRAAGCSARTSSIRRCTRARGACSAAGRARCARRASTTRRRSTSPSSAPGNRAASRGDGNVCNTPETPGTDAGNDSSLRLPPSAGRGREGPGLRRPAHGTREETSAMRSAQRSALMLTALGFLIAHPALAAEPDSAAAAPASPAPAAAPADADVIGRLDALTEQMQALQSDTDKLKRFKFSGYVQVRYDKSEASNDSVQVASKASAYALNTITPANQDRFYIRRGRFKLTYDSGPLSQEVLYFDGGTDRTLRLLEATVTLFDPWTVLHAHALTIGQMNVPFGYELERSDSERELLERSRAEIVLFPG